MIVRIVQMTFAEERVEEFLALFNERKHLIRNFDGCTHLELWQDAHQPTIFFTYSIWLSEVQLNHYRFSSLFKDTWAKTQACFANKPQAWSLVHTTTVD